MDEREQLAIVLRTRLSDDEVPKGASFMELLQIVEIKLTQLQDFKRAGRDIVRAMRKAGVDLAEITN